jgi:hypothetical protein
MHGRCETQGKIFKDFQRKIFFELDVKGFIEINTWTRMNTDFISPENKNKNE